MEKIPQNANIRLEMTKNKWLEMVTERAEAETCACDWGKGSGRQNTDLPELHSRSS